MIARLPKATRLPLAIAAVSIAAVAVAPIGVGASVGAPSGEASSGEVICRTITEKRGPRLLRELLSRGSYWRIRPLQLHKVRGRLHGYARRCHVPLGEWKDHRDSRRGLRARARSVSPRGPGHDTWGVGGQILKDTTGKITAPLNMVVCGPKGGWTMQPATPAQF
jgi:hypothetical protein